MNIKEVIEKKGEQKTASATKAKINKCKKLNYYAFGSKKNAGFITQETENAKPLTILVRRGQIWGCPSRNLSALYPFPYPVPLFANFPAP